VADEARRRRIVAAALRALDEQDYERIQMRDVATAAGIALGTLYRHFSSKEHLYATVLLEWAAAGRSEAVPPPGAPTGGTQRVRARVHGVITAYERQPHFYRVQVTLRSSADPNARAVLTEFHEIAKAVLAADLEELRPGDPSAAADAAAMLWALVITRLKDAVRGGAGTADVHRHADTFIDLLAEQPHPDTS
jgi:AcrR family transcriptional regulator